MYKRQVIVCVFLVFGLTACNNSEKSDYQTVNGSDTVINNGESSNDDNACEITSVDDDNKSDDSKVKYFNKMCIRDRCRIEEYRAEYPICRTKAR